jgi:hypothetical protein
MMHVLVPKFIRPDSSRIHVYQLGVYFRRGAVSS